MNYNGEKILDNIFNILYKANIDSFDGETICFFDDFVNLPLITWINYSVRSSSEADLLKDTLHTLFRS